MLLLRTNESSTYEDPTITNVNPITTPVLDSRSGQPISPNVYYGPPISDCSNPNRLTFEPETVVPYDRNRRESNDGEVTAVHGANEIRTVLVDKPESPRIMLRSYDDLRGRITRSRQPTIDEISAIVVSELTKRLVQTDERVDDELTTFRARLVKTETLLRGLRDHPVAPPPAPVEIESVHTNTDYRRNLPRAAPTATPPMAQPVAPIAPNPLTFDALTTDHTQLPTTPESRPPQVPRAHTVPTHHTLIEFPTIVPGLDQKRKLLSPFNQVVSYEAYRLEDKRQYIYSREGAEIYRLKKRICGLLPTLHPFDGKTPISLLTFFSQLREGLDALGVAEAAAVRVLPFLLDGDAKLFYDSVTMTVTRSRNTNRTYTCPYVVHSSIDRYLTDTELQDAYDRVSLIAQRPNENEKDYADQTAAAARDCANVFEDHALVHHFVRGLLATTRELVTEDLRRPPEKERNGLTDIR